MFFFRVRSGGWNRTRSSAVITSFGKSVHQLSGQRCVKRVISWKSSQCGKHTGLTLLCSYTTPFKHVVCFQPLINVGKPFPQQSVAVGNAPSTYPPNCDEIEDDVNWDDFL